MLTPISRNPSNTVGLAENSEPKFGFIGKFDQIKLQEWLETITANFGDAPVYLYSIENTSGGVKASCLLAAVEHGDEMQVAVAGLDHTDVK